MSKKHLTARRLRELLDYESKTGIWRWRVKAGRSKPGEIASPSGTWMKVDGRAYAKTIIASLYAEPDEAFVEVRSRTADDFDIDPEAIPKRRRPRLKANPRHIAERLRALRVPEHAIARHLVGMRQAVEARQQIRRSNHTEQEEYDDGRA